MDGPFRRWAYVFNAALTIPFFHWLIGPSEFRDLILRTASSPFSDKVYHHPIDHVLLIDQVIEVEVNGVRQRSGVLIKKRRYV